MSPTKKKAPKKGPAKGKKARQGARKRKPGGTRKAAPKKKAAATRKAAAPVVIPGGQPVLVSTNDQVGAVLGVDQRTVRNWKRKNSWPGSRRGPYDLTVIGPWHIGRLTRPSDEETPEERARIRKMEASAQRSEIEIHERLGVLVSRPELEATIRGVASVFGRVVQNLRQGTFCAECRETIARKVARAKQQAMAELQAKFGPGDKPEGGA